MSEAIAALATAYGIGSVSIVRLSGKDALATSLKLLKLSNLEPRYAKLTKIYSLDDEILDEGIVIFFKWQNGSSKGRGDARAHHFKK